MEVAAKKYTVIIDGKLHTTTIERKYEDATLDWLRRKLEKEVGYALSPNVRLVVGNAKPSKTMSISYLQDVFPLRFKRLPSMTGPNQYFIKLSRTDQLSIQTPSSITVQELKKYLEDAYDLPANIGLYTGQGRLHGSSFLKQVAPPDSVIDTQLLVFGGGSEFVNIGDDRLVKKVDFSATAPAYRIVGRGLNLEGKCSNAQCAAYKKMVIVPINCDIFDLILDQHRCLCPLCQKFVNPTTCGFWNCSYFCTGIMKKSASSEPTEFRSSDWTYCEESKYTRYTPVNPSDTVIWTKLKIHTIPERRGSNCCIHCGIAANVIKLSCGHFFDEKCIEENRSIFDKPCGFCRVE